MRGAKPSAALEAALDHDLALERDETLVVAVSGGPDSIALGALAARAAQRADARVVLAHVNHGVRDRAWQDEAVVLSLATSLAAQAGGTRIRVAVRALAPGSHDEARLRDERYAALLAIAREAGARRIATAHHARDQTETVLLALFRGTGPEGLAGMAPERELGEGIRLVRPLLRVDPAALRTYCAAQQLAFALDPTNADTNLRRNAVRALLNDARPHFPGLDEAVARCAQIARDERAGTPRAALRRSLREQLREALGDTRDLGLERIDTLADAIERGSPGRHFVRRGVELSMSVPTDSNG
jgi:tRNA(Ile)-lysidine synthase